MHYVDQPTFTLDPGYKPSVGPLRAVDGQLRDDAGRQVILRGPNFSGRHKQPPHTFADGPDALAPLHAQGFDVIRLVLAWEAIEPQRGRYDEGYLARIADIARWAGAQGLSVIADMHQDLYSRAFGGSGAPAWAIAAEDLAASPGSEPDAAWFTRYATSQAVRRSLQRFFSDADDLQGAFIGALCAVTRALHEIPAVIGFEPFNEPFAGELGFDTFEREHLEPFYRRCIDGVRAIAPAWLCFFEGALFASEIKLELDLSGYHGLVYLPHFYDKMVHATRQYGGSSPEMQKVLAAFDRDARARGIPWMLGEYGIMHDAKGAFEYLRDNEQALERYGVGGTFWQYNPTELDWNDERMSVVAPDGSARCTLAAVARPYPRAVAGRIDAYRYDDDADVFELRFDADEGDTLVAIPERCFGGVRPRVELSQGQHAFSDDGRVLVLRSSGPTTLTLLPQDAADAELETELAEEATAED
ncbi:MAG: cellulase family glycosylhydrolase [Myxococcales bacterium]|nr:cellulase family glycosylhydrolase [Myxococcales bacterium]